MEPGNTWPNERYESALEGLAKLISTEARTESGRREIVKDIVGAASTPDHLADLLDRSAELEPESLREPMKV